MSTYEQIYNIVKLIPKGRVATYGQIAKIVQCSGPRQVGYALHALPDDKRIPWHRVINAQGRVSPRSGLNESHEIQQVMLEAEGIEFDRIGRVPLKQYQWKVKIYGFLHK